MATAKDDGKKWTAAQQVLNTMMEVTGSSMEECRAMLASCGGDPNRSVRVCGTAAERNPPAKPACAVRSIDGAAAWLLRRPAQGH